MDFKFRKIKLFKLSQNQKTLLYLHPPEQKLWRTYRQEGGMAEWSNAAVLKTVEGHTSGGSNPSSSADIFHFISFKPVNQQFTGFLFQLVPNGTKWNQLK